MTRDPDAAHAIVIHDPVDATDDEQRRRIIEAAQNAMLVLDARGTIELANAAAERLTGYAPGTLVGQHVNALDCPAISAVVESGAEPPLPLDPLAACLRDGARTIRRGDGTTMSLEIVARRFNAAGGVFVLVSLNPGATAAPARRELPPPATRPASERRESSGGWWRLDVARAALTWSDEVYRLNGLPASVQPTMELALRAFHPDDRDRVDAFVRCAIRDGSPYRDEARIVLPDGTIRSIVHGARVERGAAGEIVALAGFFHDITERNEAQRERQRLDSFVMLANQAGRIGIWELDLQTNVSTWDRNMYALYGIDDLTIVPTAELWLGTLHPDDRAGAAEKVTIDIARGVPSDTEFRIIWQSGEVCYIRSLVTIVRDAAGTPTRIIGTDWDVTELRSLAEQLREEKELLVASESRYRALTEAMPQMVVVIDADASFEYVNWRWSEYTGLSLQRSQMLGFAGVIHPLDAPIVRAKRTREPAQEFECEARMLRGDGVYRWHLVRSVPFADATGDSGKWIITATDIEERKAAEKALASTVAQLEHVALHDPLTNLPNRKLLMDRLAQAIGQADRANAGVIVLYVDLDRFKAINDTFGHAAGDRVLIETAERIARTLRVGDTASRVGGDEFIIVCAAPGSGDDEMQLASRLLDAITLPIMFGGERMVVDASIGLSVFPADGVDAATLIRKADVAMYSAKQTARNTIRRLGNDAHDAIVAAAELETELRHALTAGELVIHYQPIIGLRAGGVVAAEALVRWQHSQRGLLEPAEFIPFAEDRGLIAQIGDTVLDAACATLAQLRADGERELSMCVNVSAQQFGRPDFVDSITTVLRRHALDPCRLEIEITESVVMGETRSTLATLNAVRALGVTLSIDDFGTGYSSLSYIKKFPISSLKIDRSFVHDIADDLTDQAIAKTIVTLAKSLNMNVIAEGVETQAQLSKLQSFGVDRFQGFIFSRPLPLGDFQSFIRTFRPTPRGARPARRMTSRAVPFGVGDRGSGGRR